MDSVRVSTTGTTNRPGMITAVVALVVGLLVVLIVLTSNLGYFAGISLITYAAILFVKEVRHRRSSS